MSTVLGNSEVPVSVSLFFAVILPVNNTFTWVGLFLNLILTFYKTCKNIMFCKVSYLHHLQKGCSNPWRQVTLMT
jgi:hypothetical protein